MTLNTNPRVIGAMLHSELTDDGEETWWATSDDYPGFSAAADTRSELLKLVREAVHMDFGPEAAIRWLEPEPVALAVWTSSSTFIGTQHPEMRSDGATTVSSPAAGRSLQLRAAS
jgi:hypothetical protein